MRVLHLFLTLATTSSALEIPFFNAISLPISLDDYIPPSFTANQTSKQQPKKYLQNRQLSNGCPDNFHACSNLGAPGLCCADAAICTPDNAGNVACCPTSSKCSGVVNGVITSGTVNSDGSVIPGSRTAPASRGPISSNSAGVVISSNAPNSAKPGASGTPGGFVLNTGSGTDDLVRRAAIPLLASAVLMLLGHFLL